MNLVNNEEEKISKIGRAYPRITKDLLKKLCKEQSLYLTPELNDVLYLHFKGFTKIENLEDYTGLKCLWLENNGIRCITGLGHLKKLRCLYLHYNYLMNLDGIEQLSSLISLNVSYNAISDIKAIEKLPNLETLHINHNNLCHLDSLKPFLVCKKLACLDLSHNKIEDTEVLAQIFSKMEELSVLQLTGNSFVRSVKSYRNKTISSCLSLKYLDDRPVFPVDRAAAEAWSTGGYEAEKTVRKEWAEREHKRLRDCVNDVIRLRERMKREKALNEKKIEEKQMDNTIQSCSGSESSEVSSPRSDKTKSYLEGSRDGNGQKEGSNNKDSEYDSTKVQIRDLGMLVIDDGESKVYALTEESKKTALAFYNKEKQESCKDDEQKVKENEMKKNLKNANPTSSDKVEGNVVANFSLTTELVSKATEQKEEKNKEGNKLCDDPNDYDICKKSKFVSKVVAVDKTKTLFKKKEVVLNNVQDDTKSHETSCNNEKDELESSLKFNEKSLSSHKINIEKNEDDSLLYIKGMNSEDADIEEIVLNNVQGDTKSQETSNIVKDKINIDESSISIDESLTNCEHDPSYNIEKDEEESSLKFNEEFLSSCKKFIEKNEDDSLLRIKKMLYPFEENNSDDSDIEEITREVSIKQASKKHQDFNATSTIYGKNWMKEANKNLDNIYQKDSHKIELLNVSDKELSRNLLSDLQSFAGDGMIQGVSSFSTKGTNNFKNSLSNDNSSSKYVHKPNFKMENSSTLENIKKEATSLSEIEKILRDAPPPRTHKVNKTTKALLKSHESFIKGSQKNS